MSEDESAMRMVTQDDMNKIFEVVDALEISREAIKVPLKPEGDGSVEKLASGHFRIVIPESRTVEDWLPELRKAIQTL